jgi:hypothetical protein
MRPTLSVFFLDCPKRLGEIKTPLFKNSGVD